MIRGYLPTISRNRGQSRNKNKFAAERNSFLVADNFSITAIFPDASESFENEIGSFAAVDLRFF